MTAITLPLIESTMPFPNVETALSDPDGLLAFGGDLSVQRLVTAYKNGIFPWFSQGEPILWWSPSTRCIINPEDFHISRSLKKTLRKGLFHFSLNCAFEQVIQRCANTPRFAHGNNETGTWITHDMVSAYIDLHRAGLAHSVEVWQQSKLVGGLYGVVTDNVFCGESMFHSVTDASKAALSVLVSVISPFNHAFIDCQMPTEHLLSLGATTMIRKDFIKRIENANRSHIPSETWKSRELALCLD